MGDGVDRRRGVATPTTPSGVVRRRPVRRAGDAGGAISLAVIYRIFSVAFGIMPMVILLEIGTAESRACGRSYSS